MKRPLKSKIEESLLWQLESLGASREHYVDQVADYMSLHEVKQKLIMDIRVRGVVYEDVSSVGVKMQKNNPSVKELVMVNRQMLTILKELGLNTSTAIGGDEDDL